MRTVWMERRGLAHLFKVCGVITCCGLAVWSGKALAQSAKLAGPYKPGLTGSHIFQEECTKKPRANAGLFS